MIRLISAFFLVILFLPLFSQPLGPAYVVYFTDKDNSPYSIDNPSEFLTEAALDRRARQGIAIEADDIPVNTTYLEAITNAGAQIASVSRWFNLAGVWIHDESIIPLIEAMPFVQSVEPMSGGSKKMKPSDDFFDKFYVGNGDLPGWPVALSGLKNNYYNYGQGQNQIQMIGGIALHNQGYRGQGMVIAVLDAGFRNVDTNPAFDSLRAHNRILGARDFVQPGNNVYKPTAHAHGNNVLSVMAANLPGQMVGTAPEASYWLLRTEDHDPPALPEYLMEEYFWMAGAEFADSVGAWVINSSLGYTQFDDPTQNHTYADLDGDTTPVTRAANRAASKGILVVNSAGNYGSGAWQYIIAPADGFDVLAVGAVDAESNRAFFSSIGPSYDGRIKPDVTAQGAGTAIVNSGGNVQASNGTSFSSPVIAGMAACLWQTNNDVSNADIYQAIIQSASQFNNPDNLKGYGIPDFEQARLILTSISPPPGSKRYVRVYPNPVSSHLVIETLKSGDTINAITFSDLTGRIIFKRNYEKQYKSSIIEFISALRPGIYLLKVDLKNGSETVKVVKL